MIRTVEAVIDHRGTVRLLETVELRGTRRTLVTILEEKPADDTTLLSENTALLSEKALAGDWDRPEEDDAWSHFQQ